jgi:hypothetical protein
MQQRPPFGGRFAVADRTGQVLEVVVDDAVDVEAAGAGAAGAGAGAAAAGAAAVEVAAFAGVDNVEGESADAGDDDDE